MGEKEESGTLYLSRVGFDPFPFSDFTQFYFVCNELLVFTDKRPKCEVQLPLLQGRRNQENVTKLPDKTVGG